MVVETELSSKALSILNAAGWNGSPRNIESDMEDLSFGEFNAPPDYVISFLRQYSGIEFDVYSASKKTRYCVSFGLDKAMEIPNAKLELEKHAIILQKKELYPIGSVDSFAVGEPSGYWGRETIAIDEDECVYLSTRHAISQGGHSVNDFINRIVDDQLLAATNKDLNISYSEYDPRLKEFRLQERERKRAKSIG
jgi:hypothetical protein